MMIRTFDSSGAVVCWDSERVARSTAKSAFDSIGRGKYLPAVNQLAAITDAAKVVAKECGMTGRDVAGNALPALRYFTLDRSSVGVGVYQEIRGKKENEYRLMFSAGVDDTTGNAEILKIDPRCGFSEVWSHATGDRLNDVYRDATNYLTASDLTKAINALLRASHTLPLRENGSVYFLPGEYLPLYQSVADSLEGAGPQLHCWKVDLANNPKLMETLHDSLHGEILQRMEARQKDWDALVERGAKARSDGLQTRFDEMQQDAQLIEFYEQFLSVRLEKMRSALEKQQAMIGMAHLDLWSAQEEQAAT
jgi:hypothetical protein